MEVDLGLFRSEVYEERKTRLHGDVLLTSARSSGALVGLLCITVFALTAFVILGHYARTESAVGYLVPDGAKTDIYPTRAGIVTDLKVAEGASVNAGDPLLTVLVEQASAKSADPSGENLKSLTDQSSLIQKQIASLKQTQLAEAAKLSATSSQTRMQSLALSEQIANQARAVQSASDSFEPLAEAANEGYISRIEYEARRQQLLSARIQLAQLKGQQAELIGQARLAQISLSELPAQIIQKVRDLEVNKANLVGKRLEIESAQSYVIKAPISGRISAMQVKNGSMVASQIPLLSIVSSRANLHAELYVPSRAIGFVKVGQEVRLMYDAFPYQRFGSFEGRVVAISRTVLAPNEIRSPVSLQARDPVYLLMVAIPNQNIRAFGKYLPLQSGMTLQANLVLDRRSFLDWILSPINAVRNRN